MPGYMPAAPEKRWGVLFSGGCRLAQTEIRPLTPGGMPLIAAVILMIGLSLIIFALKRVFSKK